jgi:hypothetical protein
MPLMLTSGGRGAAVLEESEAIITGLTYPP